MENQGTPAFNQSSHQVIRDGQTPDYGIGGFPRDGQAIPDPIPPTFQQTHDYGYVMGPHFGAEFDYVFQQLEAPPGMVMGGQETGIYEQEDSTVMTVAPGRHLNHQDERALVYGGQQANQQTWMPKQIPFVISGIDTPIHMRLFCHFTQVMSNLLTIPVGESNPMNGVVLPLAMKDRTIMDTLLCLAGSHILKLKQGIGDEELSAETSRLHRSVVRMQSHRVQTWETSSMVEISQPYTIHDKEVLFATSVLLCLYEICEGSGDDSWRGHLDAARKVLVSAGKSEETQLSDNDPPVAGPIQERVVTEIDPFLIEYFLYHDSLAAVTVPLLPMNKPRLENSPDLANHDPTMVGVQDGLSEFITRISLLRAQADLNSTRTDGNIVSKAVKIWEDLARWRPRGVLSTEREMIAEFYQWALFIWLFSIVYPDGKSEQKVQDAVKRIVNGMRNIKFGDGVMSCMLFPLFVIGSAAIEVEDKEAITAQFRTLKEWSSLGNIDLTYNVVEKMWLDYDLGVPRSWDWVSQLETHGTSLLVT